MPEINQENQAWNIADPYAKLIFQGVSEMRGLVTIATYGVDDMANELFVNPEVKKRNRINALNRLIDCEREIFETAKFQCIKKKKTKARYEVLKKRLNSIVNVINGCFSQTRDERNNTKRIEINEEHFNLCLENLRYIKEELPVLLDEAGLVFPPSNETDIGKIKDELIHGG
jgi:hypothetical protein